jgi:hypothetical protein
LVIPEAPEDDNLPRGVLKQQPFVEKWTDVKGKAIKMALNFTAPVEGSDTSAAFRAPSLPGCMESTAIALKGDKDSKYASILNTINLAGANALANLRTSEIEDHFGSKIFLLAQAALKLDPDQEVLPEVAPPSSLEAALAALDEERAVSRRLRTALGKASDFSATQRQEVLKVSLLGASVAAGSFDEGVGALRSIVCDQVLAPNIVTLLKSQEPSLLKLFGDDETLLEKVILSEEKLNRQTFKSPRNPKRRFPQKKARQVPPFVRAPTKTAYISAAQQRKAQPAPQRAQPAVQGNARGRSHPRGSRSGPHPRRGF